MLMAGCLVDSNDRCSPGEEVNGDDYCVCKANHIPRARDVMVLSGTTAEPLDRDGCVACGEHQVAAGDTCACEMGYAFNAKGKCVKPTVAKVNFGETCASDDDCTGPGASCIDDDELGMMTRTPYCSTRDCADPSECPSDKMYGCFSGAAGTFCRKPPSGEGDTCDMADGAESNPACQNESTACVFGRCTAPIVCGSNEDCTPGLICCDLTVLAGRDDALICTTSAACPQ